jgi:hypothetical protein
MAMGTFWGTRFWEFLGTRLELLLRWFKFYSLVQTQSNESKKMSQDKEKQ